MGACSDECFVDNCKHLVRAYQHIVIPEPQHLEARFMQPLRARNVTRGIKVLASVDFDDQIGFEAGEIHDVRADRKLTSETVTKKLSTPQMMP